jgi:hypothetical protein
MRYRMMERDVTDPLALLHDIVAELEAAQQPSNEISGCKARSPCEGLALYKLDG